jgi:hypothetical protein
LTENKGHFPVGVSGNPNGRPKGPRQIKVTLNRIFEDALEHILDGGTNPLTFIANVMDDEDADIKLRFEAARELNKYITPNLPRQIEVKNTHEVIMTQEQILLRFKQIEEELKTPVTIDAVFEEVLRE